MGQCMSRKAAGAFAASAAGAHNRPSKKKHAKFQSPDDNHKLNSSMKKNFMTSKGVATSFGFKRRPATAPSTFVNANQNVGRRLAFTDSLDSNGNDKDTKSLTANIQTNGRSTPRLPPPKKEGSATQKVGRFGFRQSNLQVNRSNRVADLNAERLDIGPPKNSSTPKTIHGSNKYTSRSAVAVDRTPASLDVDNNRNRTTVAVKTPAHNNRSDLIGRFTLQTNQLPRPQPIRVMETKTAKTIANNSMKFSTSGCKRISPEDSSKEGSLTEDSGLGSHVGTDFDISPQSPTDGKNKRNLIVMVNGNTFQLRDPDAIDLPLPKLPNTPIKDNSERSVFQNTGLVRERTFAYEQQIEKEIRRKISATSSEGFSDGSCQKEDLSQHKPLLVTQKSFLKPRPSPVKTFLKTRIIDNKGYSSASSDDIDCGLGGEALADEVSICMSSSDESRDKDMNGELNLTFNIPDNNRYRAVDESGVNIGLNSTFTIADERSPNQKVGNMSYTVPDEKSCLKKSLIARSSKQDVANLSFTIPDEKSYLRKSTADRSLKQDSANLSFTIPDDKSFLKKSTADRSSKQDVSNLSFTIPDEKSILKTSTTDRSSKQDVVFLPINIPDEKSFVKKSAADISSKQDVLKHYFTVPDENSFLKKSVAVVAPKQEFRPVTLTIADSNLEAAAQNVSGMLLDDETSPVDDSLLSFSEPEEAQHKLKENSSDSKDINEKPSPSSPGTPTTNSLSLSEGKDDFLIDDEIADQPALVGDKSQKSESNTLIELSTPLRRRKLRNFEGSPLVLKDKGNMRSSTVSLDTLSPCESIASDDLMMDFDGSHSSGLDECDKLAKSSKKSLHFEDTNISVNSIETDIKNNEEIRDWSALLNCTGDKSIRSGSSRPRFLRSRTGTPNSVSDSPSSLEGKSNGRLSTPSGSLRRFVHASSQQGYESDDSIIKLDRNTQIAIKNDIVTVKSMLFKLRGVLNEQTIEDTLLKSETRNPFEDQTNGHSNGLEPEQNGYDKAENDSGKLQLADLRRQVLFLQGQLEDKEKTVMSLQEQLTSMCTSNYQSNSAPASTTSMSKEMSNAATQTDRIRRLSTEPSLTNCSQLEATQGNLVSVTELSKKSQPTSRARPSTQKMTSSTENSASPIYQRLSNSKTHTMIPRRSESRSRAAPSSLS